MFSHAIIRGIVEDVNKSDQFAIIVDGTQDVSGASQESICMRFVDKDLEQQEVFLCLYSTTSSSGESIAQIITDTLLRLNLPIANLRGQSYDGASNMAGQYAGCSAFIARSQPLALFNRCGAHCVNLVVQNSVSACAPIRDAVQLIQELGTLYSRSEKYRIIFKDIAISTSGFWNIHFEKAILSNTMVMPSNCNSQCCFAI